MPRGLQRLQESRQSHFVAFSCYHRQANFDSPEVYDLFLRGLEQMRQRFAMCIYGDVVMLLVSEPGRAIAAPIRAHSLKANLESSV
jgi:putative transposase